MAQNKPNNELGDAFKQLRNAFANTVDKHLSVLERKTEGWQAKAQDLQEQRKERRLKQLAEDLAELNQRKQNPNND